jgi:hypothetical protein
MGLGTNTCIKRVKVPLFCEIITAYVVGLELDPLG